MPTTASVVEKLKNNVVTFTQTWLIITHILVVFVIKTFLKWLWLVKKAIMSFGNYVTFWSSVQCLSVRPVIPHLATLLSSTRGNSHRLRTTDLDVDVFPSMLFEFVLFRLCRALVIETFFNCIFCSDQVDDAVSKTPAAVTALLMDNCKEIRSYAGKWKPGFVWAL